jgi:hypothetical protein
MTRRIITEYRLRELLEAEYIVIDLRNQDIDACEFFKLPSREELESEISVESYPIVITE